MCTILCFELLYWKITGYFKLFLWGHLNLEHRANVQEIVKTSPKMSSPLRIKKQGIWGGGGGDCAALVTWTVRIFWVLTSQRQLLPNINITKWLLHYIMAILISILSKSKCALAPTKLISRRKVQQGNWKWQAFLLLCRGLGVRAALCLSQLIGQVFGHFISIITKCCPCRSSSM